MAACSSLAWPTFSVLMAQPRLTVRTNGTATGPPKDRNPPECSTVKQEYKRVLNDIYGSQICKFSGFTVV